MREIKRTMAEKLLVGLDSAAWAVDEAEGHIPGIGYVQITRAGNRRNYWLDGIKTNARNIYEKARDA